jgi:hypothetical protein
VSRIGVDLALRLPRPGVVGDARRIAAWQSGSIATFIEISKRDLSLYLKESNSIPLSLSRAIVAGVRRCSMVPQQPTKYA